jgi:hypothetical protein
MTTSHFTQKKDKKELMTSVRLITAYCQLTDNSKSDHPMLLTEGSVRARYVLLPPFAIFSKTCAMMVTSWCHFF